VEKGTNAEEKGGHRDEKAHSWGGGETSEKRRCKTLNLKQIIKPGGLGSSVRKRNRAGFTSGQGA